MPEHPVSSIRPQEKAKNHPDGNDRKAIGESTTNVGQTEPPTHLLDLLQSAASSSPQRGIHYLSNGLSKPPIFISYHSLLKQARTNAAYLRRAGIGRIAITYFDNHRDNVEWFWSVVAAGGICAVLPPISNEPRTAAGQLENVKSLFGDTAVITTYKLSALFRSSGLNVKTVETIQSGAEDVDLPQGEKTEEVSTERVDSPISSDSIAAILFTSGSTGPSKAVQFSHKQLISSVLAKVSHLSTHTKPFMSWVSFDHSACFCEIHLQALYAGSDQFFVPTSDLVVEPDQFFHLLSEFKIGYTFAPNFFLAAATKSFEEQEEKTRKLDFSELRVIMCGGEANRTSTLEKADALLRRHGAPPHAIKAAYGLSETCSACFYNLESPQYDSKQGNTFASVGQHLPGVLEMKLVPADGSSSCKEGVVHLRGEVIFKGYYGNPEATLSCMTPDGWMNTGDIGRLDSNGNLQLLGRVKEVLILHGQNYSSFDIEYAIESGSIHGLEVSYTAAFSTWDYEKNSEGVVILFNPTEAAIGPRNLRATLQAIGKSVLGVCSQQPLQIVPLPKALLPKSTIGKLSRAALRQQYETGLFNDYLISQSTDSMVESGYCSGSENADPWDRASSLQKEIATIYSSIVNIAPENLIEKDLLTTGIDSLGFIRLKRALERGLKIMYEIPMPVLLRCHSILDLEHELTLLGTVSQQYEPCVPLATQGSKQPLFLLHPGGGEFLCWIGLLKYLPDRPIYALRAKGLHSGEGVFETLDEVLDCYYAAIREVQPNGPYALLGYCFGGLLCFELAKRLEAAGETVNFCGGMDNPPTFKGSVGGVKVRSLIIDILPILSDISEPEARQLAENTASLSNDEFCEAFATFSPQLIEQMDITVPRLQAWARVEDSMRLIIDKYVAEGKVSTMDVFCADPVADVGYDAFEWRADVLSQWKEFVKDENVIFHEVQGKHTALLKDPAIHEFQKVLIKALEGRGV